MAEDLIGYQQLTENALRDVVRMALKEAADNGLPGGHHFYITFKTGARGVEIAPHLKDQFPDEMTIVIQHQFWDLEPKAKHFEIVLKFSGVPQHLVIPYAAITRFVDPSINFGLVFHVDENLLDAQADETETETEADAPAGPVAKAGEGSASVVSLDAFRRK